VAVGWLWAASKAAPASAGERSRTAVPPVARSIAVSLKKGFEGIGKRYRSGSVPPEHEGVPMSFEVPSHVRPIRDAVESFVRERVEPAEPVLHEGGDEAADLMARLQADAKAEGLWALGHPKELGGGGLPFMDYVYVNEVQGRSEFGQLALGTFTLQDSIMLHKYASPRWRSEYLDRLVQAEVWPSFAMTEPEVASSDPTQLRTTATLDGDEWVIRGHKWFTTGANRATYTTVMCRTEDESVSPYLAYSMIVVPTDTPGYTIVRETPVLGIRGGHCEVVYDDVRVPAENLLGPRGHGFVIAQERLGPGRIFHCMRWLGQAQRAFELMCQRLNSRTAFGEPLAAKQLMQQHVFESYAQIQSCRLLTLHAAAAIDRGEQARVEIGAIKVVGARMLHDAIDRAIQCYGAAGLTDDTPLSFMYRAARFGRIYDGPDEVHVHTVARRILKQFRDGGVWDFAGPLS
jgi:alkylation response protein AidB-like acyl-CoA dehydrogenase